METTLHGYSVNLVCCNGCGACASLLPELFAMDAVSEKPVLLLPEAPAEAIERAMAFCPHDCIEMD
ncbi:ferredoxin [Solidesulfovibrio sp.]|uniref:ferredoxin n=1 Tax=Solidesulfovibrio sp. TaxID=2910990 RepID=UPI00260A7965|nr:ferredoxin [Solidesulfovibrio sp.]